MNNKIAVITGGSKGIGFAAAGIFAKKGYRIFLISRSLTDLEQAKVKLKTQNPDAEVEIASVDVSQAEECESFCAMLQQKVTHVNALINCAGINIRKTAADLSIEEYRRIMATDLDGTFYMCKFMLPLLKAAHKGKIVNTSSLMALVTRPRIAPYAAAKAGVSQLTKALAIEWAPFGINVNAVIPGFTLTEMVYDLQKDTAFNQFVVDRTPSGKWINPEQVGDLIYFLASDKADAITGVNVPVDGGIAASLGWKETL